MASSRDGEIHVNDLEIGQRLIEAHPAVWADSHHRERPMQVLRTTKTRLILGVINDDGNLIPNREVRVILEDGYLTNKVEGQDRYRNPCDLYTEDDEVLPIMRAKTARSKLRNTARKAMERAGNNLTPETAQEAVTALQEYLDANAAIDPSTD